jgi:hypothetical protein
MPTTHEELPNLPEETYNTIIQAIHQTIQHQLKKHGIPTKTTNANGLIIFIFQPTGTCETFGFGHINSEAFANILAKQVIPDVLNIQPPTNTNQQPTYIQ